MIDTNLTLNALVCQRAIDLCYSAAWPEKTSIDLLPRTGWVVAARGEALSHTVKTDVAALRCMPTSASGCGREQSGLWRRLCG